MNSKFLSVATLFAAGTLATGAPTLGARTLETAGATLVSANCGSKDPKDAEKPAPAGKDGKPAKKDGKHKDGKCGAKHDGSCGKDKKDVPPADKK